MSAPLQLFSAAAQRTTALGQHVSSHLVLAGNVPSYKVTTPPGGAKIMTIIGWVGWGVFAAAVAGVLIICIKMAISAHKSRGGGDGGGEEAGKLFWPLLACIIGSSVGAILGVVA